MATEKDKPTKEKESKEVVKVKKKKKIITKAVVYVNCTYNNTIISFADHLGNIFASSSSGCVGIKGARKGTAYAATKSAYDAYDKASKFGIQEAAVVVKGVGMGRKAAVKGLRTAGLIITSLSDRTPIPHNGCRPRKKPRGS